MEGQAGRRIRKWGEVQRIRWKNSVTINDSKKCIVLQFRFHNIINWIFYHHVLWPILHLCILVGLFNSFLNFMCFSWVNGRDFIVAKILTQKFQHIKENKTNVLHNTKITNSHHLNSHLPKKVKASNPIRYK